MLYFILTVMLSTVNTNMETVSDVMMQAVSNIGYPTVETAIVVRDLQNATDLLVFDPQSNLNRLKPAGSVMKLFALCTLSRTRELDPEQMHRCRGWGDATGEAGPERCWLKMGHGNLNMTEALAVSCNAYFYEEFKDLDFNFFTQTMREWGLFHDAENIPDPAMSREEQTMAMIGRWAYLLIKPIDIVRGVSIIYCDRKRVREDVCDIIRRGMNLSYIAGTASQARKDLKMSDKLSVYCKTGTGVEYSDGRMDYKKTNGYFVGVYDDRYLVFVFKSHGTGAGIASHIGLTIIKWLIERNS